MEPVKPIAVTHLFPETLDALLYLLTSLDAEDWDRPTACAGWTVHDVAAHLLGDDAGILARRDKHTANFIAAKDWAELVAAINHQNNLWVQATRRISPRLLCDLLRITGDQVNGYLRSLDADAIGGPVSWAGSEPAPAWLDLAREYTERWHHQQHIRDAVGQPGLTQPRFLRPVLDTFVRALPHTFRDVAAPAGTQVALEVTGEAGAHWTLQREPQHWTLFAGRADRPAASLSLPQDAAWRLFTKGLRPDQARAQAVTSGNEALSAKVLETVSLIA